jgi:hypothetical protein
MGLAVDSIIFDELASDPVGPIEGQFWYNTTEKRLKVYRNGAVEILIDKDEFDAHVNSTSNPHAVTLEQARSENNVLAGDIDMNNAGTIANLPDPTADGDAATLSWTNERIRQRLAGLDWQESVLDKDLSTPPGSPSTGDRYIVGKQSYAIIGANTSTETFTISGDHSTELSAAEVFEVLSSTGNDATWTVQSIAFNSPNTDIVVTGDIVDATADGDVEFAEDAWNGSVGSIAQWNGTSWEYAVPNEGFATTVEDEDTLYLYDGTAWAPFGNAIHHSNLTGLGLDDHTQYLLVSGTRPMLGSLQMGGNSITNVNLVDGVDVSNHSVRHDPGGLDALTTATASGINASSVNAEGSDASFARSDHSHDIDTTNGAISTINAGDTSSEGVGTGLARRDHEHAVATDTAVELTDSTNDGGTSTSLARADHTHAHGDRGGGTLHSAVSALGAGFQVQSNRNASAAPTVNDDNTAGYTTGSYWIDVVADRAYICLDASTASAVWTETTQTGSAGGLLYKAGRVLAASFTGSPRTATVVFSTAFADANYAVTVTATTTGGRRYLPVIQNQLSSAFDILLGSNSVAGLTQVNWIAVKDGESS